METEMEQKSSS